MTDLWLHWIFPVLLLGGIWELVSAVKTLTTVIRRKGKQ